MVVDRRRKDYSIFIANTVCGGQLHEDIVRNAANYTITYIVFHSLIRFHFSFTL